MITSTSLSQLPFKTVAEVLEFFAKDDELLQREDALIHLLDKKIAKITTRGDSQNATFVRIVMSTLFTTELAGTHAWPHGA